MFAGPSADAALQAYKPVLEEFLVQSHLFEHSLEMKVSCIQNFISNSKPSVMQKYVRAVCAAHTNKYTRKNS